MEPGWFVLLVFMLLEATLVLLLSMPMPNNTARGAVITFITSLWEVPPVRYVFYAILAVDIFYFWFVFDALLHPLYDFGLLSYTGTEAVSCEIKAVMYQNERNAYITGFSLFLFLILSRMIDIQKKLHLSRETVKQGRSAVPIGRPVIPGEGMNHAKPHQQ